MCASLKLVHSILALFAFLTLGSATFAQTTPGTPIPAGFEASDQKVGSVLVYNYYTSSGAGHNVEDTRFSITNTHPTTLVAARLFFIDGVGGSVADLVICLTPNQTATFLASDLDPGIKGYVIAVAVSPTTGCPIGFNYLMGDEYIKLATGHEASLGAEGIAALYDGVLQGCDEASEMATLRFDGVSYNQLPCVLAIDKIRSPADGNSMLVIFNPIGGNLAVGGASLGAVAGRLFDDAGNQSDFNFSGSSQFRSLLTDGFPVTAPAFSSVISSNRTGWMRFQTVNDTGFFGSVINFNPNAATASTAFKGGHNLRQLALSTTNSLIIPVNPPGC